MEKEKDEVAELVFHQRKIARQAGSVDGCWTASTDHARFKGNYAGFLPNLDSLMGIYIKDYLAYVAQREARRWCHETAWKTDFRLVGCAPPTMTPAFDSDKDFAQKPIFAALRLR